MFLVSWKLTMVGNVNNVALVIVVIVILLLIFFSKNEILATVSSATAKAALEVDVTTPDNNVKFAVAVFLLLLFIAIFTVN